MNLRRPALTAVACVVVAAPAGCASSSGSDPLAGIPRALVLQSRPIGRGTRFHPPATGPVLGSCSRSLGARVGVHIELFAANRVVLVAQGIGTRPPRSFSGGRILGAGCYGELVTIDPTGLLLVRPRSHLTVSDLFRSWGQALSAHRLASFPARAGGQVIVFVNGHRSTGPAAQVPLTRHAEIVLEVGPWVPPHSSYTFPPST